MGRPRGSQATVAVKSPTGGRFDRREMVYTDGTNRFWWVRNSMHRQMKTLLALSLLFALPLQGIATATMLAGACRHSGMSSGMADCPLMQEADAQQPPCHSDHECGDQCVGYCGTMHSAVVTHALVPAAIISDLEFSSSNTTLIATVFLDGPDRPPQTDLV